MTDKTAENLDGPGGRDGPLAGLRILDIATVIAGPLAGTLLADYGAEVVKVELPGRGDSARDFPPFKDGKPLWWKVINRNKKFITLDLRESEGQALLLRLVANFDVLIENFRPGTLDRWGLTTEALWRANPRLVILRTTAYGQDGPYRDRPGFARLFEAMGGLTHITGEPDGEPMHTGYPIGDSIGGLFGALGILAALMRRAGSADLPGEEIDLSMTEAVFRLLDFVAIEWDQLGVNRGRSGNTNQYSAPAAVYRTSDGQFVSLSGSTNALYAANARAIDREDLIDDPRFCNNRERVRHARELNEIFATWVTQHTLSEVLAAFDSEKGTIAPIYSAEQIFADPQMQARKAIVEVPDVDFGIVRMQGVVPRFSRSSCQVRHTAGHLGKDNEQVYGELGISAEDLAELQARGIT